MKFGKADPSIAPASERLQLSSKLLAAAARSVRTIVYDRASGGAEHCQMGAQALWHADLFDWIAGID